MANNYEVRILEEGPRNAIVRVAGILTASDITLNPLVTLQQFTNNLQRSTLAGLRVDCVEWSISTGAEVVLQWVSNTPQIIVPLAGRGKLEFDSVGGLTPDPSLSGYTGGISMYTVGQSGGTFVTGQVVNFSLTLKMVKLYR